MLQQAIPGAAPLMSGQKAIMLNACESSDQFKASLEEEHRSMGQFHIDCLQVPSLLLGRHDLLMSVFRFKSH